MNKGKGHYWLRCDSGMVQTTGGELIKNIHEKIEPGSVITVMLDMDIGALNFNLNDTLNTNPIQHDDLC